MAMAKKLAFLGRVTSLGTEALKEHSIHQKGFLLFFYFTSKDTNNTKTTFVPSVSFDVHLNRN